jgi:oligopeptide/dipeptide ABC transporter ATP-binding protein
MSGATATDGTMAEVSDLKVHFPITRGFFISRRIGTIQAVDGVSFSIGRGETLGLVGESGCGKSTIGRAMVRLTRPTSGSVRFDGVELAGLQGEALRALRRRFQMIFQDPYSSLDPRMTVRAVIAESLDANGIGTRGERDDRVGYLLEVVGLGRGVAERYPHEFSGGQRQRIAIARALASSPDLLVSDEPVSALDVSIQAQIVNLLERLQAEFHFAQLFIAHDLAIVRHISGRIAVMYLGRIVELASSAELYREPLHPYTVALLSAVPIPDPVLEERRRRIILRGEVPSPAAPPSGCRFHTRCWLRERLGSPEVCQLVDPPLRELAPGHVAACHFAEQVAGFAEQAQATGRPRARAATTDGPAPAAVN